MEKSSSTKCSDCFFQRRNRTNCGRHSNSKASEASTSAQNAALSQQAAQQAKTDAQSARDAAAKSAESAAKSAETAAQMASAHLKEIIPLSIDAEGWSAVEGEDGIFSHSITHEKITATSYLTINPGSDTLLSAFSEIGYAGGYIKNDGGNVNWFIKAGQKPSSPFSVQLTLEQAKEGSGPIYTSLNTGGGSGGGFVVSDTQPEKITCCGSSQMD